jgi:hypothetical protein
VDHSLRQVADPGQGVAACRHDQGEAEQRHEVRWGTVEYPVHPVTSGGKDFPIIAHHVAYRPHRANR